jgi:O-phospho-L-seryl-tRNASec:L-selenocysteinyl-tRNA synthase
MEWAGNSTLITVYSIHFYLNILRSGNVNELQPKAVGSSLLVQLTCSLVKNMLHSIGMNFISDVIVFPSATGMAITISLLTLRKEKEVFKINTNTNKITYNMV